MSAPAARLFTAPAADDGSCLVLHGGAGGRVEELTLTERADYEGGLAAAHAAGEAVLRDGGSALDAVCATVGSLEDNPLFNAGRGASLTASGRAELDASVMTGDGRAGAVAATTIARSPVRAARAVMERTAHVLLVAPPERLLREWGLELADPGYFITEARQKQLARVLAQREEAARHGTVGAVARDRTGRLAAATSTGGMVGQADGRVGDTPIIGSGTFARDGVAAISCTGEGEAFMRAVVAHEIAARMVHGGAQLTDAVTGTIAEELTARGGSGGVIAADAAGIVIAHNSPAMFAAFREGERLVTLT